MVREWYASRPSREASAKTDGYLRFDREE